MMPSEIVTAVQERIKVIIVLVDNHGYASIGSLSQALGSGAFGTQLRFRSLESQQTDGDFVPVDFVGNARSLGAHAVKANNLADLKHALQQAKESDLTTLIVVETDREARVPGYNSWWDVAVAEVSESERVRQARTVYEEARQKERHHL
jgi:3D-(3,5/4)-trihydroxycyclohexane-1,2-dione acylhydrolase (decyclizing)